MANQNNIAGTISTTNSQILASGLNLPSSFNNSRSAGEIEQLYVYKNNAAKLTNKYKSSSNGSYKMGETQSNFRWAINDIKLISNWQFKSAGIQFAIKQTLLQGLNPFNETKLYNPLMPILGSTSHATLGVIQGPIRFIEPNLGGVLGSLGLTGVSNLFGTNTTPTPPKGTVGASALAKNSTDGGKGLSRGKSATNAYKTFQTKWPANSSTGGSFLGNALAATKGFFQANTAVGTFFPVNQPDGSTYKAADTKIYGTMLNNTSNMLFKSGKKVGRTYEEVGEYVQNYTAGRGIGGTNDNYSSYVYYYTSTNGAYSILVNKLLPAYTSGSNGTYPSNNNNLNDKSVKDTIAQLNTLLKGLSSDYSVSPANYIATNYKDLVGIKSAEDGISRTSPENYNNSGKVVSYSKSMKNNRNLLSKKGIDTGEADSINLKGIISGSSDYFGEKSMYPSLGYDDVYSPYADDIIAFYFHDIVNDKYIPFRATVKGIQESLSAEWTDIKYMNRADKIYNYSGFTRTLNFNFVVAVTSIKELLPVWKRINYFCGLVKPANYTDGTIYSRFIIPPLVDFTIGDMYKHQPAVITQIGISVPEDATWEVLSETYSQITKEDWSYLNGRIKFLKSKDKYAQFPNQCEINVNMNLLEKELPRVGGANYGDYYMDKNFNAVGTSGKNSFSNAIYTGQVAKNLTPEQSNDLKDFGVFNR
jgi:hypothetical protein